MTFAENQPEYLPLPAHREEYEDNGTVTSCWKFTLAERIAILFGAPLWLQQLTFGDKLQPQLPRIDSPFKPSKQPLWHKLLVLLRLRRKVVFIWCGEESEIYACYGLEHLTAWADSGEGPSREDLFGTQDEITEYGVLSGKDQKDGHGSSLCDLIYELPDGKPMMVWTSYQ